MRSRRPTARWPASITPTPTRVTPRPKRRSSRSPGLRRLVRRRQASRVRRDARYGAAGFASGFPGGQAGSSGRQPVRCGWPAERQPRRPVRRGRPGWRCSAGRRLAGPPSAQGCRPRGRGHRQLPRRGRRHGAAPAARRTDGPCHTCGGTGAKPGTAPHACAVCGGSGQTCVEQGGFAFAEACRACHGRGLVVDDPCPTCAGIGVGEQTRTVQRPRARRCQGRAAHPAQGQGWCRVSGRPGRRPVRHRARRRHPLFGRKGDNLTVTVPVTFPEAALGATVSVPTLDGAPVMVKVPAGTPNGRTFRVRGRGVQTSRAEAAATCWSPSRLLSRSKLDGARQGCARAPTATPPLTTIRAPT